jgi:nucleoside-diphosphate-sugar epimerase
MDPMHIFVTGATGVIGRRVVPLLLTAGHQVTGVGRSGDKRAALERQGAATVDVDIFDAAALARAVAGHDAIVNLATHMPPSTARMMLPGAWKENDRVRRLGSANLVDAAVRNDVRRFIQESFAPIYADRGDEWIDERWRVEPARYNRSTLDAELSAERFSEEHGAGIVLRFAFFYGSDAFTTRDMMAMVRRGWAPIPGAPDAYISSIAHDDAASAVVAALDAPAGIYNVVDDEPLPRRELAAAIAGALGVKPPRSFPQWLVPFMGSSARLLARSQRISNGKLRAMTGWAPRFASAREGWAALAGQVS